MQSSRFVRHSSTYLHPKDLAGRQFDFIIAGGGSAGCTLANRLSESKDVSVLVLEAGTDADPKLPGTEISISATPGLHLMCHRNPEIDWCYTTTKQDSTFGWSKNPGETPYARGRGLGGSGSINFSMWTLGAPEDQDTWEEMGATGWNYENCRKYFNKSENVTEAIADGYRPTNPRGMEGPMNISRAVSSDLKSPKAYKTDELARLTVDAFQAHGFIKDADYNGGVRKLNNGASLTEYSIKEGKRSSSATALLKVAPKRPNLHIALGVRVAEIGFKSSRANGLQLIDSKGNSLGKVFATNEIILSAGVINTPQILMLSGIGPKSHLQSLGIPMRVDLPIGENWSDHLYMIYKTVGGKALEKHAIYGDLNLGEEIGRYLTTSTGLLARIFADVVAYATVTSMRKDKGPDLQIVHFPTGFGDGVSAGAFDPHPDVRRPFRPEPHEPAQSFCTAIAQPKSRGNLKLRSKNPFDTPYINPNMLSHPDDRKTYIAAYKMLERIALDPRFYPGTSAIMPGLKTDEEILNFVKFTAFHGWHGCGTCRMGSAKLSTSVVDEKLRVIGVDGLRVCDVSTFPVVSSGNTNAPTIMVAERGASLIKADYPHLFK